MAKNIASENIFDGLKGGPAAAQKTVPVQEATLATSAPVSYTHLTLPTIA